MNVYDIGMHYDDILLRTRDVMSYIPQLMSEYDAPYITEDILYEYEKNPMYDMSLDEFRSRLNLLSSVMRLDYDKVAAEYGLQLTD